MLLANETSINSIFVTITPEGQSADDIELSASTDAASPPLSQTGETIALAFLEKVVIRKCPAGAICRKEAKKSVSVIGMPVIFDKNGVTKNYDFVVSNVHLGFAGNGESAVADLPTVVGGGPAAADEILYIKYQVQDATAYDWSTPPLVVAAGGVAWSEPLIVSSNSALTAEAPPSEITGTNHAAEAQDNRDTFMSGILLGVAGAAAIAAAQEGLHLLLDDRNDGTPRKLRRIGAQSE